MGRSYTWPALGVCPLLVMAVAGALVLCRPSVAASPAKPAVDEAKSLEKQVLHLLRADPAKYGRDALVAQCQEFLATHPNSSHRAEIMVRIGRLNAITDPVAEIEPKPELALKWFKSAVSSADTGTDVWCEAKFGVSEIVRNLADQVDQVEDLEAQKKLLAESREALDAIAREGNSPFVKLRAEMELVNQYRLEGNPLGMEMQAKRVLEWQAPQGEGELDPNDAQMIRVMKMGAVHNLAELAVNAGSLEAFAPASLAGPKEQRAKYLVELAARNPNNPDVARIVDRALKQLKARQEPKLPGKSTTSQAQIERSRHFWITVNVLVVAVLGLAIAVRYRALRQQP